MDVCHWLQMGMTSSHLQLLFFIGYTQLLHNINLLNTNNFNWIQQILSLWCHFLQCPWDLCSVSAERVGQGEAGGCTRRVQTAWLPLGLAVEMPWLWKCLGWHWVGHFSIPLHDLENSLLALPGLHFWQWSFFLDLHWQSLAMSSD